MSDHKTYDRARYWTTKGRIVPAVPEVVAELMDIITRLLADTTRLHREVREAKREAANWRHEYDRAKR